jgi:O-antigen/teichoic acid export membrane protein
VQRGVGFLRGVLFCRWLDADQLGQWDLAYGCLMLAAPAIVLGLPGSLGRYVDTYLRQGQLRTFLRRVATATFALTLAGITVVVLARKTIAQAVFNDQALSRFVLYLATGLAAVIALHFLVSLLTALRKYRAVSIMQLSNSLLFAGAGIALLATQQTTATTVLLAFVLASGVTAAFAAAWLIRVWRTIPATDSAMRHGTLWAKLMPFAVWLWLTNWLSNLFVITDRFMIIHFSGFASAGAMALVGQYHSARVVPALFVGLAETLAAVLVPHLASDWESGRADRVAARLRLIVKSFGVTVLLGSTAVMIAAPLLFDVAFQGKYSGGQAILPWALACSVWTGLASLTYSYLWCAEKSRYVAGILAFGLMANVVLNFFLVPSLGLLGAVLATGASRLVALGALWIIAHRQGMRFDRGLLVVAALPLLLPLGVPVTLVVIAAILFGAAPTARLFSRDEQHKMSNTVKKHWLKAMLLARPRRTPVAS